MKFGINCSGLSSEFFARLIEGEAVDGLKDLTLYVRNDNAEWSEEASRLSKEEKCEISVLDKDADVDGIMSETDNLLMPVATMDNEMKLYLVGAVNEPSMLETAADFLMQDAARISNMGSIANYDNISFRGAKRPIEVACLGDTAKEAYENIKGKVLSYEEMQKKKMGLVAIGKNLRSTVQRTRDEAMKSFAEAMAVLSNKEKDQVIMALLMNRDSQNKLEEELNRILNRDQMGENTKYKVVVEEFDGKVKVFIEKPSGKTSLLKLSLQAMIIYLLNLLYRKKNGNTQLYDIRGNEKEFIRLYEYVTFNKYVETSEKNLIGNIKEHYNDIENKLADVFSSSSEDYSPFMVNACMPIVVRQDNILISERLYNWFFEIKK